jgi:alpha-glucosidase
VYGLLMNRAAYEGLHRQRPEGRPFILSRSGWVGVQRYAWTWTADVETSWRMPRQTIATVLGLGLCGVPYSGPDIGGFTGAPSPELFVRWFQIASYLPFFRTHCAFYLPCREPWEFGDEVLAILRFHLEQRYRLLPYWYTQAWRSSVSGHPLVRPLFWNDAQNRALWEVDDAFLVGDDLLVAPVVVEGGRSAR